MQITRLNQIELRINKTKREGMMNIREISQGKKVDVQKMIEFYDQLDGLTVHLCMVAGKDLR